MKLCINRAVMLALLGVGVTSSVLGDDFTLSLVSGQSSVLAPNQANQTFEIWLKSNMGTSLAPLGSTLYLDLVNHGTSQGSLPTMTSLSMQGLTGGLFTSANSVYTPSPNNNASSRYVDGSGVSHAVLTGVLDNINGVTVGANAGFRFARVTISTVGIARSAQWDLRLYDSTGGAVDSSFFNVVNPTDALNADEVFFSPTVIQLSMVPEPEMWAGFTAAGLVIAGTVLRRRAQV